MHHFQTNNSRVNTVRGSVLDSAHAIGTGQENRLIDQGHVRYYLSMSFNVVVVYTMHVTFNILSPPGPTPTTPLAR